MLRIGNACISAKATLLNLINLRYFFSFFFLEQTSPSDVLFFFFSRKDMETHSTEREMKDHSHPEDTLDKVLLLRIKMLV